MFDLVGLHDYLVSVFHRHVDLGSVEYISPLIVQAVKADVVFCTPNLPPTNLVH